MKRQKKVAWLGASLVLVVSLTVPNALAIVEHIKQETLGTTPDSVTAVLGEAATGSLDNDTQPQSEYQKGYQAGYQAGLRDAFQWMITTIQEQMAGISLEGPKIKQTSIIKQQN